MATDMECSRKHIFRIVYTSLSLSLSLSQSSSLFSLLALSSTRSCCSGKIAGPELGLARFKRVERQLVYSLANHPSTLSLLWPSRGYCLSVCLSVHLSVRLLHR